MKFYLMKYPVFIFAILFNFTIKNVSAQNPLPAKKQNKVIVLQNATLHTANATNQVLEKATIIFENGKITQIGASNSVSATAPAGAEVLDMSGKHVYPGLILPSSTVGLTEVDAVRATRDFNEVGAYNPHIRAQIAYNTDAEMLPTIRNNGILLVQSTPRGGVISGSSSVMELEGWNWEDATLKADDGIHLNWVSFFSYNWQLGAVEKNKNREKNLNELNEFFVTSSAYFQNPQVAQNTKNLRFEAMKGLFEGSKNLYIHADLGKEIVEAIDFAKKMGVKKIVLIGGSDSWMLVDYLKENNIPVLLNRPHSLPNRADDDIDLAYKLPAMLQKAGILVGLNYEGDMEAMGSRNLPFVAGSAAAYGAPYGLTKEDALKMITANTARILGIDKQVGTLEVGKEATLIVSGGDILDMKTSKIELAFVKGKKLLLNDKQKALYEKFKQKE